GSTRRGMVVVSDNGVKSRDLTWLDNSAVHAISNDGRMLLFDDEATRGARVFVRNVDGSPAIEVGPGSGLTISPDKAWALTMRSTESGADLWLSPIGPGQPRRVTPPGFRVGTVAQFFADGRRIAFVGTEGEQPPRTYVQRLDGGTPRPISAEGVIGALIS